MLFRVRSHLTDTIERAAGFDLEAGIVPAIISSGARARDGFILEQQGLEFERFRESPVVLFNHDDASGGMFGGGSQALPIARSSDETFDDERDVTTAVGHFDLEDEFAVRVLGKIDRKLINATSIRWIPLEHRIDRMKRHEDSDDTEPVIYGLSDDRGRLMLVATFNTDLGDAWEYMDLPCYPEKYSGQAYRMGINFMVYAMTH